jgi:hypothetical protein
MLDSHLLGHRVASIMAVVAIARFAVRQLQIAVEVNMIGEKDSTSCLSRGTTWEGHSSVLFSLFLLVLSGSSLQAESLSLEYEMKIGVDFGGMHVERWSEGALVNFVSNETAAPTLLSFDDQGKQLGAIVFTIPGAKMIDLDDIARSPDGSLAVCGKAFDQSGRGSGFIAITSPTGDLATTVRLYPYYPTGITFASDGTIWTIGLEAVDGKETGPGVNPANGVIRHFDRTGKLLGSVVPRSSLSSPVIGLNGYLRSANGRIGWYTGPPAGPGSQYYEIFPDGTFRKYPAVALGEWEVVTGLALTDNGRTYVTTSDAKNHSWRLLSISAPGEQWKEVPLPDRLKKAFLCGSKGGSLAFRPSRSTITFMNVSP